MADAKLQKAMKEFVDRSRRGVDEFVERLAEAGGISKADAEKVFAFYTKIKAIKHDWNSGVFSVKHGAFFDREVIGRALEQAA